MRREKLFFVPIGISGSGKSTVASRIKDIINDLCIVSQDNIMFEMLDYERTGIDFDPSVFPDVKKKARSMFLSCLDAGKHVLYDATNLSVNIRAWMLKEAKGRGYTIIAIPLIIHPRKVIRRSVKRGRCIPVEKIYEMQEALEMPSFNEGFDYILSDKEVYSMLEKTIPGRKKDACVMKNISKPWNENSVNLLHDNECLQILDVYSIRFHDSTRPHFDYAIGNVLLDFCVDFIIPRPLEYRKMKEYGRHEYKGKHGYVLTSNELARFIPNLPERGDKMILKFMPVHSKEFLVSPIGKVNEIPEGAYGAGEWFVVEKGEASMIKRDDHFLMKLGDRYFNILPYHKDYLIQRR